MSDSQDYSQEIHELLTALHSGSISEAQAQRVVELLRESAEARRCFLLSQGIVALIHRTLADFPAISGLPGAFALAGDSCDVCGTDPSEEPGKAIGVPPIPSPPPPSTQVNAQPPVNSLPGDGWFSRGLSSIGGSLPPRTFTSLVVLVILSAAVVSMWGISLLALSKVQATSVSDAIAARLVGAENCQWSADCKDVQLGQNLPAATVLKLLKGVAYLRYADGALVVMNGPAEFTIENHGGYLRYGNMAARVPPTAMSFTIRTSKVQVVDFGTEFGVRAEQDGVVDVHVFQGQVQAWQVRGDGSIGQRYPLASQMAMRIQPGSQQNLYFMANRQSFPAFESADHTAGYRRWEAYRNELRNDIDLLAYYDFQNSVSSQPVIFNSSMHPLRGNFNITRYGATQRSGRWAEKKAFNFRGSYSKDYLEIDPASQAYFNFQNSFSVALWFRVDQFDAPWQALIAKGDNSWRLQRFGTTRCLFAGLSWRGRRDFPKVEGITPVDDRRWHLAVGVFEYGNEFDEVRLYLDGRLEGSDQRPHDPGYWTGNSYPVRLGDNAQMPGRNFSGLIDEVAIFQRALTPEEILRMYQAGISLDTYR